MRTVASRPFALCIACIALLVALAGCSSESGNDGAGLTGSADSEGSAEEVPREAADDAALSETGRTVDLVENRPEPEEAAERAIISKGSVSLSSDDVEKAAFDVQRLADEYAGEVTERETTTDDDGEVRLARLVLRIPADDFTEAFTDLEQVADLESSSATSEDVTTKVIDTEVRIRAQRRSIRRVEVLLDRAQTIRDIIAIEAQLTRRQADLDSLEQRLAYLRDQTAMSTIAVHIERAEEKEPEPKEDDDAGFLSGLSAGWSALVAVGTGLATAAGAVLPFAVVLVLLGFPVLLLIRTFRRRRPVPADAPATGDAG